jgi:hypothetical protein
MDAKGYSLNNGYLFQLNIKNNLTLPTEIQGSVLGYLPDKYNQNYSGRCDFEKIEIYGVNNDVPIIKNCDYEKKCEINLLDSNNNTIFHQYLMIIENYQISELINSKIENGASLNISYKIRCT